MIDIYCKDNICPICSKEIEAKFSIVIQKECLNGCYLIKEYEQMDLSDTFYIYTFGHASPLINTKDSKEVKEQKESQVLTAINYFKKDDRYLAEILSK